MAEETGSPIGADFARLIPALQAEVKPGEKVLAYILSQFRRFGHTVEEPRMLLHLFEQSYDRIIVVTAPRESWANPAIHDLYQDRLDFYPFASQELAMIGHMDKGLVSIGALDLLLIHDRTLATHFQKSLLGGPMPPLTLSEEISSAGKRWLQTQGVDATQPLVLLHVRDDSFKVSTSASELREGRIEGYVPAVQWLLEQGYAVLRLGDRDSPRLSIEHPHLIELSHLDHTPALDVFAAASCQFAITVSSGPNSLVSYFDKPRVITNLPLHDLYCPHRMDLIVPKRFTWTASGEPVEFSDFCARKYPELGNAERFVEAGITVDFSPPEEILGAVQQMHSLLEANEILPHAGVDAFKQIAQTALIENDDYKFFTLPGARLADASADARPELTR